MYVSSELKVVYGGWLRSVAGPTSTTTQRFYKGNYEVRVRLLWKCPSFDATLVIQSYHEVMFKDGQGNAETQNSNSDPIRC